MRSRRRREHVDPRGEEVAPADPGRQACGLCGRPIPAAARASRHHLVPKLKGGARLPTVRLHQICHSAVHARYSEADLARRLADLEALRAEPALAEFLAWIRTKPPDFHARTRMTGARRETLGKRGRWTRP